MVKQHFFLPVRLIIIGLGLLTLCFVVSSWGVWGHQHINKAAVFALPDSMRVFYYNHIDFMTEESVVPDIRKYTYNFKSEGPRHFIDLENFEKPIDSLPRTPAEANKIYEESFLQKNGSLPWFIQEMMEKLTTAMRKGRKTEILALSADLGHYLGDAYMPLHTSSNYDGQLTAQSGIHSFFESQLPELYGDQYNLYTGDAHYMADIPSATWAIIKTTHNLADTMLAIDRSLSNNLKREQIWQMDAGGKTIKNTYGQPIHSVEYARLYHEALHGMVEQQIRLSISSTADFWYTAWVNAGKPDLNALDDPDLTVRNKEYLAKDYAAWKKGKLTNLKVVKEF